MYARMQAPANAGARAPSIRRLVFLFTIILGSVAVLASAGLVWTSTLLRESIAVVIRDAESQAIANELHLSLFTHYRLTSEEELGATRSEVVAEMRQLLVQAEECSGSVEEAQFLDDIARYLSAYLREHDRLEARGSDEVEIMRLTQPRLSQTSNALYALRKLNQQQVQQADARALRVSLYSTLMGAGAGVVFAGGLVVIIFGVRRHMLRPILALHHTITRFKAGDIGARASGASLYELAELAQGFNEMAESLAMQREAQLTFLAGVAHDLRNPLSAIKLGIQALEQEQSEARRSRARETLDRQVDRLARMVGDLLDATRVEAGSLEMRVEEVDVRDVVQDMVRLYAPTSPDHQIAANVPPDRVVVAGDPLRLEQVVSNLLSNAIKFSPGGGPIEVSVRTEGDDVVLTVADRGLGIPHEERPTIFLPFRRQRAEVAPGAGLGLSVVRRIVMAHGGGIEVESEPGVGSTFRVRLPRVHESTTC